MFSISLRLFTPSAQRSRVPPPDQMALQRRAFWRIYTDWTAGATLEELELLHSALDQLYDAESDSYFEAQSVVIRIRESMGRPQREAHFPSSLISALRAANWPAVSVPH